MSKFDKAYKEKYFYYHHKPIPVHDLDARMFQMRDGLQPQLVDSVQRHILYDIQAINDIEGTNVRVHDYVMVGPVLDPEADKSIKATCPVYIIVQLNTANLTDVLKEKILMFVTKNLSSTKNRERLLTGTQHPVRYKLTVRKINLDDYASVFHPYTNTWLKSPRILGK